MQMILFCGIQATGKSTYYKERFFKTHVHISMDVLNTRNKEQKFIDTCFACQMPFVVDNTNPTVEERAKYIAQAKANKYQVVGYYFQSKVHEALARNNARTGKELIPESGVRGTFSRLVLPNFAEGFDELYYVSIGQNQFTVNEWTYEI